MTLESFREALRRVNEPQDDNFIILDCGHQIFADPNWNEFALSSAIDDHKKQHH